MTSKDCKAALTLMEKHTTIESTISDGTTHEMVRDLKERTLIGNVCNSPKRITRSNSKEATSIRAKGQETIKRMILTAINTLEENGGSSRYAILKYITENYPVNKHFSTKLNCTLIKLVKKGELEQVRGMGARGSYRNSEPTPSRSTCNRQKSIDNKWNRLEIKKKITQKKI